jgi:hypothetical protein
MATDKNAFVESLKSELTKLGLPGQQRDVVQWLLVRYIGDVNIIAGLNQVPMKRQQLLDTKNTELLAELSDLSNTETPAPPAATS